MKKFNIFKIVQLSLLILVTLISVYLLMQPEVKQYIFASTPATILFIIIWIVLLASYVFLLIDFSILSSIKLNYHNLYGVAYSDPLSGIPNRFSCDTLIEKYYDTTLAYVAEKIRQNDSDGGISAGTFQGQECLVLKGGSGDIRYTTYIYSYKGKLKELTLRDDTDASPSDGKDILAVADFSVSEIKPGLFRFTSTDTDGTTASVTISERSRQ